MRAVVNATFGRFEQAQTEAQQLAQQQAQQQTKTQAQSSLDDFKKAYGACMDAKGYSVK
jgi:hypothetical protein